MPPLRVSQHDKWGSYITIEQFYSATGKRYCFNIKKEHIESLIDKLIDYKVKENL